MFLRHVTNECQVAQGSGFALGFPWAKTVDFHWPKKWGRRTTQGKIQICNMCKEQNPIVKQWSGASFSNKMFLYTRANYVICFCENKILIYIYTVHSQISHIQEWELRIQIFRTCFIASVHLRMRTNEPKRVLFNEQVKKDEKGQSKVKNYNKQEQPSAKAICVKTKAHLHISLATAQESANDFIVCDPEPILYKQSSFKCMLLQSLATKTDPSCQHCQLCPLL